MLVGGYRLSSGSYFPFLYSYGIDGAEEQIFKVQTFETAMTYYYATDFRADFLGIGTYQTITVGLRDEA